MAKKTFKENPALRFISTADNTDDKQNADNTTTPHIADDKQKTVKTHKAVNKQNTDNDNNTPYTHNKHYADNDNSIDITYNVDNKQERKTKRLNLLIQPSILENLSKIAHMKETSVNDLVNSLLKNYAETEKELISLYEKVFSKKL
jgi:hypothetical protein